MKSLQTTVEKPINRATDPDSMRMCGRTDDSKRMNESLLHTSSSAEGQNSLRLFMQRKTIHSKACNLLKLQDLFHVKRLAFLFIQKEPAHVLTVGNVNRHRLSWKLTELQCISTRYPRGGVCRLRDELLQALSRPCTDEQKVMSFRSIRLFFSLLVALIVKYY